MANTAGMRGKDDERKLFVGGLPRTVTEKDIKDTFAQYGNIESINVKMDPVTGQPRGFCFIVFTDASIVNHILTLSDVTVLGKKVDPRRVTKNTQPGKFFVGGIPAELNEEKIKEYFGQFGTITEVQWPFDKLKNQRKAYCFITMENKEHVNEVLKKPKQTIQGVEVDVKRVKFNPETMWAASPYGRPPRGYPPYGYPAYPPYGGWGDDYGYDDYYAAEGMDPYYDGYTASYDAYAPSYAAPTYSHSRPPRGRAPGYARHAPY